MGLAPSLASAQGIGLPAAGFAAGGTGLTSFYVIGFELGPWQEYLAQELTPDYMLADDAQPVHVSWLRGRKMGIGGAASTSQSGSHPITRCWI